VSGSRTDGSTPQLATAALLTSRINSPDRPVGGEEQRIIDQCGRRPDIAIDVRRGAPDNAAVRRIESVEIRVGAVPSSVVDVDDTVLYDRRVETGTGTGDGLAPLDHTRFGVQCVGVAVVARNVDLAVDDGGLDLHSVGGTRPIEGPQNFRVEAFRAWSVPP